MAEVRKDIDSIIADEDNLRSLINSIDDPLWLVDANYIILECNHSFRKWVHHFIGKELDKGDQVLYDGRDKMYQDKFEMCYQLALKGRAFKSVEDMKVNLARCGTRP